MMLKRSSMRISLGDVDGARLIYFSAPFGWSERVFSSWLADIGRPMTEMFAADTALPVVATHAEYHSPLRQDETVELAVNCGHVGRTSFSVTTEIHGASGSLAVVVNTSHVYVDHLHETPNPAPLPDWLRLALGAESGPKQSVAL